MEITSGENVAAVGKHQWIVGRRTGFDFKDLFAMIERASHRPMNLRHATQTVGVLDARIVRQMRLPDLAVAQKIEEMLGDRLLTGMWPRLVDARVESGRRSLQCFQSDRARNISDMNEPLRP